MFIIPAWPAAELHFTSAARNAVWIYSREAPARFPGAPAIVEQTRTSEGRLGPVLRRCRQRTRS
jgi:hypothetical protein